MSRYDVDWDEMEDLRVVAPFFDDLRAQFAEGPAPQIGTELATLFVFGAPPIAVVNPPKPTLSRSRVVRRVAAGAVGGLALVGGMGAAGALPAPIQEPVAMAARHVGLNLPRPHHHHERTPPASNTRRGDGEPAGASTSRIHKATHVPSTEEPTATDGSTAGSGTDTQSSGTVTGKSGSGSTATTANSTVTSHSGSAVSSTTSDKSGGPNDTGGRRPTYHGNGRTTRDRSGSTSTTSPPTTDGTGSGDGGTTPSTTPTTAAPAS